MPQHRDSCRSCDAPVVFVKSAKSGKLMILDADPVPDGNIVIRDGHAEVLGKKDLFAADRGIESRDEPKYKDHHATCPNADQWRRKAKP